MTKGDFKAMQFLLRRWRGRSRTFQKAARSAVDEKARPRYEGEAIGLQWAADDLARMIKVRKVLNKTKR